MTNSLRLAALTCCFALVACIPMKTLRGSSGTFLTPMGAKVNVKRTAADVTPVVQQVFMERGFQVLNKVTPAPNATVFFFRGSRAVVTAQNNTSDDVLSAGGQIGSWFAVRVTEEVGANKSVVAFYGKPTVYGKEVCADQDDQLRDTNYTCTDVRVNAEWPAGQLVEGREETEIITAVIATLTERLPER
jgi:hypothetical protein